MNSIALASLAALAFGFWTLFHKIASPNINQVLGSVIVQIAAFFTAGIYLLILKLTNQPIQVSSKGIFFVILAGITAAFIDILALAAYSKGLPVSIGGPIIIGGSIAVVSALGLFLGDTFSFLKIFALLLIIIGSAILAKFS